VVKCDNEDGSDAVLYCATCMAHFCAECHSKPAFRNHATSAPGRAPPRCGQHGGKELELYCEQCKIAVCSLCASHGEHKGHATEPLSAVARRLKESLSAALSAVERSARDLRHSKFAVEATLAEARAVRRLGAELTVVLCRRAIAWTAS
jgi:hypothetical protein